jgi:ABC-2 type transport system ATP-binding protein
LGKDLEVEVRDLTKRFGKVDALKGVSFGVQGGEVFALLGPNGAGKTTTIKILTGLIRDFGGEVFYKGSPFSPRSLGFKRVVGVVPQHNNVDRDLTVEENLKVHCYLHSIFGSLQRERIDEALQFTGLQAHLKRKADHLSGGMKRRLIIGRALLHQPRLLFLDEPTVGLDPAVRRSMWDLIRGINSLKGCTVVLTTHYIEEAEMLAHRVVILDGGKVVSDGRPQELKDALGRYTLEIYLEDRIEEEFFGSREEALERIRTLDVPAKIREVNLEDVFLSLTGRRIAV